MKTPSVLPSLPDVSNHPLASRAIKRREMWKDHNEAEAYLRSKTLFNDWDDEMLKIYLSHGLSPGDAEGIRLTCSPRGEAALFMGSFAKDPWPLLPNISCPVLILEGENSESHLCLNLPRVTKAFPLGSYQAVPNAGHLVPMEKPKEVLRIIQGFFQ